MNLGNYIKRLKPYSKRKEISNEFFANELLSPLVKSENIKNKDGYLLYLNKSRVSNLLKHKDNVPEALTEALDKDDVEERIQERFSKFYKKYIDTSRDNELNTEFFNYIKNDSISEKEKNYIINDDTCTMLLRLFLSTLKQNNKELLLENIILWQRGKNYIKIVEGDLFKYGFNKRNKNSRIIVIPVNTTFETKLSDDAENDNIMLVSKETIHGEFLNRLYIKGLSASEIKKRIKIYLKKK